MFQVDYDHHIVAHSDDVLHLYDRQGNILVTAQRKGKKWTVKSATTDETHHKDRGAAVEAMWKDHAYNHLGPANDDGHGYVTLIPHGLE